MLNEYRQHRDAYQVLAVGAVVTILSMIVVVNVAA